MQGEHRKQESLLKKANGKTVAPPPPPPMAPARTGSR
jgi:hypothetical protein